MFYIFRRFPALVAVFTGSKSRFAALTLSACGRKHSVWRSSLVLLGFTGVGPVSARVDLLSAKKRAVANRVGPCRPAVSV